MRLPKTFSNRTFTPAKAFTLIELLIVVSIMAIMTGAVIPSFSNYIKKQDLKQAQEQLKSDLRTVQNKALTGVLADQDFKYWGVRFSEGGTTYTFITSGVGTQCSGGDVVTQGTETLAEAIHTYNVPSCIYFDMATGGASAVGGSGSIQLGYSKDEAGNPQVLFNSAGLIYSSN